MVDDNYTYDTVAASAAATVTSVFYPSAIARTMAEVEVNSNSNIGLLELTNSQQNFAILAPRITGCISLFVSFGMFYHGISKTKSYISSFSIRYNNTIFLYQVYFKYMVLQLYQLLLPDSNSNSNSNSDGTITTCTIKGFFIYVTWSSNFTMQPFVYSYVGIMKNIITKRI